MSITRNITKNIASSSSGPVTGERLPFAANTTTNQISVFFQGTLSGTYVAGQWFRSVNGGSYTAADFGNLTISSINAIWISGVTSTDVIRLRYVPGDVAVDGIAVPAFTDYFVCNKVP